MNENVPVVSPASSPVAPPLPRQGFIKLSPLNRRRLQNFKANRRGYWALWVFLTIFIITLFAEFIANDRPLYVRYDGKNYFPVFVTYSDTEFGDDLGTAADYRDEHLQELIYQKDGYIL